MRLTPSWKGIAVTTGTKGLAVILRTPRFFSPDADRALLPEALGKDRFMRVIKSLGSGGLSCELSGYAIPDGVAFKPAKLDTEAPFHLEWRTDGTDEKKALNRKTVRFVEALTYWSRHVDIAIRQEVGVLIFAPWFTQSQINSIFRSAMIARFEGESGQVGMEYASNVLKILADLSSDELLLAGLGVEYQVARWSAKDWLEGLRDLQAKTRKVYAQQFARHIRFLPSARKFHNLAPIWHETAKSQEVEASWQHKALTQFIDRYQSSSSATSA